MIIHVTIKGQQIKLTRKEYLRRYSGIKQNNPYNDKMLRSSSYDNSEHNPRNHSK